MVQENQNAVTFIPQTSTYFMESYQKTNLTANPGIDVLCSYDIQR